jgi:hypothetical protein
MWDARCLAFDEFSQKGKLDVVRHKIRGALDIALLHQQLQMRHRLIFQLLQPLMKLHVVLICACVVVLPSSGLTPIRLCHFESAVDLVVERAVPFASLAVQFDGKDARLYSKLEHTSAVSVWLTEDALLALIASGRATRNITKFWPWQIIRSRHDGNSERQMVVKERDQKPVVVMLRTLRKL